MSRENPHGDGEGRCLTSSVVCGSVVERGVAPDPGPSFAAFLVPCGSAYKQGGGKAPTNVEDEPQDDYCVDHRGYSENRVVVTLQQN
jgi:hypothetical protein